MLTVNQSEALATAHVFVADFAPVRIDLDMAGAFLDALEQEGLFTFQIYPDARGTPEPWKLTRIIHGMNRIGMLERLAEFNNAGAGIFVTVNRTDLRGRKAANIVGVRALFVDGDNIPRPLWHLHPDLIVYRDDVHWHAYWLCRNLAVTDFRAAQKRLIYHYGTDPAVHDPSRVMRVPGFLHQKREPVLIQFEDWRKGE